MKVISTMSARPRTLRETSPAGSPADVNTLDGALFGTLHTVPLKLEAVKAAFLLQLASARCGELSSPHPIPPYHKKEITSNFLIYSFFRTVQSQSANKTSVAK